MHHLLRHVEGMLQQGGLAQDLIGIGLPTCFHIALNIDHRGAVPLLVKQAQHFDAYLPLGRGLLEAGPILQLVIEGLGAWMRKLIARHSPCDQALIPPEMRQLRNMFVFSSRYSPFGPAHGSQPDLGKAAQGNFLSIDRFR